MPFLGGTHNEVSTDESLMWSLHVCYPRTWNLSGIVSVSGVGWVEGGGRNSKDHTTPLPLLSGYGK